MYGWLWRKLPGGWPLKMLQSLAMVAIIGAVLVAVVFPWIEPKLPFSGNTVQDGVTETTPSPTPTETTSKAPGQKKPSKQPTAQPEPPSLPGE